MAVPGLSVQARIDGAVEGEVELDQGLEGARVGPVARDDVVAAALEAEENGLAVPLGRGDPGLPDSRPLDDEREPGRAPRVPETQPDRSEPLGFTPSSLPIGGKTSVT